MHDEFLDDFIQPLEEDDMSNKPSCAIRLSGGDIRAVYEAGALTRILEDYNPVDIIGTSAGAINTFLLGYFHTKIVTQQGFNYQGKHDPLVWPEVGRNLWNYYINNVKSPKDFVKERSYFSIAWDILNKKRIALVDVSPLRNKIKALTNEIGKITCAARLGVTYVDIIEMSIGAAKIEWLNLSERSAGIVSASAAVPIIMDSVAESLYDGGICEFLPVYPVDDPEVNNIFLISTLPSALGHVGPTFNPNDIFHLISRLLSYQSYTQRMLALKHYPGATHIYPNGSVNVSLRNFTQNDVKMLLERGYNDASRNIITLPKT